MRNIFSFKGKKSSEDIQATTLAQSARSNANPFNLLNEYTPLSNPQIKLYEAIREGVPIVDSAINKIVRLTSGFRVECADERVQKMLDDFILNVNVGGVNRGLENFVCTYLDSLLTYGNALGEMVLSEDFSEFLGLYVSSLDNVSLKTTKNPLEVEFYVEDNLNQRKIQNKNLILHSALNPKPSSIEGISVLRSLPFVTNILFKIYSSIGQNFDRIGNIRYAVTYKPSNDSMDKTYAKERAMLIAREWADSMNSGASGQVKDFITVGDVSIKVIGADNQMIDTEIPVRELLEQIVAKLSIPPFLLGLSWSTTERMCEQQTNILTTELEYYRRLLAPVILKICTTYLALQGIHKDLYVKWEVVNLKDEVEQAQSRYYNAQAAQIEASINEE